MSWFKVDDRVAFHVKVVKAGNEAFGCWIRAGAWSAGEGTNGFIANEMAKLFAIEEVWERLEAARVRPDGHGLVVRVEGGWQIHDYADYQPIVEPGAKPREKLSTKRSEAGRKGAQSRWQTDGKQDGKSDGKQDGKAIGKPMAPIPIPIPLNTNKKGDEQSSVPEPPKDPGSGVTLTAAATNAPLTPAMREIADMVSMNTGRQFDVPLEWARYQAHCRETGKVTADPRASWEKWLLNGVSLGRRGKEGRPGSDAPRDEPIPPYHFPLDHRPPLRRRPA